MQVRVREIIKRVVQELGADGICNTFTECGCGIDDLMPCDQLAEDCVLARLDHDRAKAEGMTQWFVLFDIDPVDPEEVMP